MSSNAHLRASILSDPRPPIYRVIILERSGIVANVIRLSAEDDEQAMESARTLVDGHVVELWDGLRFIDQFAPIA